MKVTFDNYTYFDPTAEDKNTHAGTDANFSSYGFNANKFNELISKRQYIDAANYAAKFHFNDPEVQRAHENDILNLRREGRKIGAIYGQLNEEDLQQVEFADNIFSNGGLERIQGNSYASQFIQAKNKLFEDIIGMDDNGNIKTRQARYLSMTFENDGKKTALGIDWLAKDNDATIGNFYKLCGFSEAQLKSAGVNVINKDGKTTLIFDGSNSMANSLIYSMSKFALDDTSGGYDNILLGYTDDINTPAVVPGFGNNSLYTIKDIIDNANAKKLSALQGINFGEKDYSSTIGPSLDDSLEELNYQLASGAITDAEYTRRMKLEHSYIEEAIKTFGSGAYEMYTNAYNENEGDETLIGINDNDEKGNQRRNEIMDLISSAKPGQLHYNAMVSNGQVGTLITIDADRAADKDINDDTSVADISKTKRYQVFIPGFLQEQAQAKINSNTTSRAAQEVNSMQDYGYAFQCSDGTELYADSSGKFYRGGQEVSRTDAMREINKTMIIEDATSQLQFQFLNNEGNLYDEEGYENMARLLAIKAANELHPGLKFEDSDGKALTVDDIFERKGAGPTMAEEYAQNTQFDLYRKYQDVFEIYDKIMNGLIYYK